jgi:hypothetical protein
MSYAGRSDDLAVGRYHRTSGASSAGSIAQAGRLVFFLSDRGFMLTDGNDVKPIGAERIDRTFKEAYTARTLTIPVCGGRSAEQHRQVGACRARLELQLAD